MTSTKETAVAPLVSVMLVILNVAERSMATSVINAFNTLLESGIELVRKVFLERMEPGLELVLQSLERVTSWCW